MTPRDLIQNAIVPAYKLLPRQMSSPEATCQSVAIALQESRILHRRQLINTDDGPKPLGPAMGFWQFEKMGGVVEVLTSPKTKQMALGVCEAREIKPTTTAVWWGLSRDDVLAAAFARLLLWIHRNPLPRLNCREDEAWDYYISMWRPGKPHRETWNQFLYTARAATKEYYEGILPVDNAPAVFGPVGVLAKP